MIIRNDFLLFLIFLQFFKNVCRHFFNKYFYKYFSINLLFYQKQFRLIVKIKNFDGQEYKYKVLNML
jgi:hypothetical protein